MSQDQYIMYRVAASAVVLYTHASQMAAQPARLKAAILEHPELKTYEELGTRYFTVWNVILQMLYSAMSLTCDLTTLFNKNGLLSEEFRKLRYTIFCGLVFPISASILTFWVYYFYDRDLIFPTEVDLIVPLSQNLMAHLGVFLYALWELVFLPQDSIQSGTRPKQYLTWFGASYIFVLYYTKYVDKGVWCYKTMTVNEDSLLFYFPIVFPVIVATIAYNAQWYIKDAVWRHRNAFAKIEQLT